MDALGTENPEEELARVQTDRATLGGVDQSSTTDETTTLTDQSA
jgi:hypothetical protein